ncbi:glucosamine-6-phosphate deaminase [Bacillus rubiinfantis]|uniref:glucosamine-6-phosphate deaminase n=1 Tax=Bacillus rubiinfantis TaxID=1499680 RepID=UPI0005A7EBC4|nr:glucosamine-6-phosphate deaminase [Bacillus rubiinfantis]
MNIIKVKDYTEMSQKAAAYIIDKVRVKPNLKLGLATGGTPIGTYQNLIKDHQEHGTSYQQVVTFNLDEYIGISSDHENSYRFYMNDHLFNHIDIPIGQTFIPNGNADNIEAECVRYEQLIQHYGGIDLQILGIGSNGHIGFNEPGTSFHSKTHVIDLAPSTIKANARFFSSLAEVPTKAITMGISTIMNSKEILLLVSGENKKEAMKKLSTGEISESFPASVLRNHSNVTIMVDQAAL